MPFINERLAENQELNARNRLAAKATRASRFTFDPDAVVEQLKQKIIGQDDVIQAMSDMLYVLKADFSESHRPLSVNLFLGPTGVGKTETVRVLTEALLGDAGKVNRIDMNTLAQEHYAAALTGAPPGYVGSKEGHTLFDTEAIEGRFSQPGIVLFDEIEKASDEVIRSLLNILDTGKLQLTGGTKTVDFSNAIIFMTSNLGARELAAHQRKLQRWWWRLLPGLGLHNLHKPAWDIVRPVLKKRFDPEFLNRIERQMLFNPLAPALVEQIIDLEVARLNQRLEKKNARITLEQTARKELAGYYNHEYGARNVAQIMRIKLNPVVAKAIVQHPEQTEFSVGYKAGAFIAD